MPKPRKRLISLEVTPYYHCISRCVRRAFLCGKDPVSGCSFEHRRQWIVDRMQLLSSVFAIDLCAYAVMSNHYHVVIRVDVDAAKQLEGREVAVRWLRLFAGPVLIREWLAGSDLSEGERELVNMTIDKWRHRLADVSWFMRCLNEPLARLANEEDDCTGRFWEGRFKSQALLDEKAVLACMAYVDLNPIRAAIADTPETSDYSSVQARIRRPGCHSLVPFSDEGNVENTDPLPYGVKEYLELVDWAGRHIRPGSLGAIPSAFPPILARLSFNQNALFKYLLRPDVGSFRALGTVTRLKILAHSLGLKFVHGMSWSKRLYAISS